MTNENLIQVQLPAAVWLEVVEMLQVDIESEFYRDFPQLTETLGVAVAAIDTALGNTPEESE